MMLYLNPNDDIVADGIRSKSMSERQKYMLTWGIWKTSIEYGHQLKPIITSKSYHELSNNFPHTYIIDRIYVKKNAKLPGPNYLWR